MKALLGVFAAHFAKEGFFMGDVPDSDNRVSGCFKDLVSCFLSSSGLPFASILSAKRIEKVFAKHGNWFGVGRIYSTPVVLWSFLSQVLRDGKEAACRAAVARVAVYQEQHGAPVPTSDTGIFAEPGASYRKRPCGS